jgi:hypothetical protein
VWGRRDEREAVLLFNARPDGWSTVVILLLVVPWLIYVHHKRWLVKPTPRIGE